MVFIVCFVTKIGHYYQVPTIRPPVSPDNHTSASPSDHRIAFAEPISASAPPVNRATSCHTTRPLPDSAINDFAAWVQHESWEFVYNGVDSSDMAERLNFLAQIHLDMHCPTKTFKITNLDGKVSCPAVKQASRRKNREYLKH